MLQIIPKNDIVEIITEILVSNSFLTYGYTPLAL